MTVVGRSANTGPNRPCRRLSHKAKAVWSGCMSCARGVTPAMATRWMWLDISANATMRQSLRSSARPTWRRYSARSRSPAMRNSRLTTRAMMCWTTSGKCN